MNAELKQESWGERAIVTMGDGSEVEVMRFDSAGSDHKHEVDEYAECIRGAGWLWIDGMRRWYHSRLPAKRIRAGIPHHMEPGGGDEPFEWIIRYGE